MMKNSQVIAALHNYPERIALENSEQKLSYGELIQEIAAMQHLLGDSRTVALMMENCPAWVVIDLACIAANVTLLPLPPFFSEKQIAHALIDAGVDMIFTDQPERFAGNAEKVTIAGKSYYKIHIKIPSCEGMTNVAKITYTSGTTDSPKPVCLSQIQMETVADSLLHTIKTPDNARHICLLPLAILLENVAGVYTTLLAGATIYLPPVLHEPQALHNAINKARATSCILVPELLRMLLFVGKPLPTLHYAAVGGARVSPELLQAARSVGIPVYEGYGLSEAASVVAVNSPDAYKIGSVGKVLPHIDLRIEDDGEISIKTKQLDWYKTGDIGRIDENGFLYIEGRKKNIYITSFGRNLSPEWLESLLTAHPAIAQAMVFGEGKPNATAIIVTRNPEAIPAAITQINQQLPDYARISEYILATEPFSLQNGQLTGTGRAKREVIYEVYSDKSPLPKGEGEERKNMTFFERLQKETAVEQAALYQVPQIVDGMRGLISRETYIAYLTQAYHHVKHTLPLLMAAGSRIPPEKEWLRRGFAEYIKEETGHEDWILNDIKLAGGDGEAARKSAPSLPVELMTAYAYDLVMRRNPIGFLGMVFVLEGTSVALATHAAEAIQKSLDLKPDCFSYLLSHGALDVGHMGFFEKTVNKITDQTDQEDIIHTAKVIFHLFAEMFRAIPHIQQNQEVKCN